MIEVNCVQGSAEWVQVRLGVLTASSIDQLLTPKRAQLSAQRRNLMFRLIDERLRGEREEVFAGNEWTERGLELEAEAANAFSMLTDLEPRPLGFAFKDESRRTGFSPDWMLDGAHAEVKCPMGKTHARYLHDGGVPAEYWPQVQFGLWCSQLTRAWFVSYHPHPSYRPLIVEVEPDEKFQSALDEAVPQFLAEMDEAMEKIRP